MNHSDPPHNRLKIDRKDTELLGQRPDGDWIIFAEDLPELPIPKHVEVTKEFIEFDGWMFPLQYVTKSLLLWMQASFIRWVKEDDSSSNRQWVEGIAEAFQSALAGKL